MSAIAKTASITLLTGVPGNGKTLRAVWYIEQAIKAGEEVFVSNLNGLNIEGVTDFPDPSKWEELPAGAILVVDEAQRFFRAGVTERDPREDSDTFGKMVVPLNIQAMETIRHAGIRLILITQSPALIHANIRALVGLHEHLVRENGKESAVVYRRSRVIDNVRSDRALASEDHETWAYPKHCYALYKSAEVHTVKRTIPSKIKRAIVLAALAACLLGYVAWSVRKATSRDEVAQGEHAAPAGAAGSPWAKDKQGPKWETPTDYAKAHVPRFGAAPWTAPVFDDRSVTADPELYCMSSRAGRDGRGEWVDFSCTCLTEQGTTYDIGESECRNLARRGPAYNPYRQHQQVQSGSAPYGDAQPPSADAPSTGMVRYRQGTRADVFPLNPAKTIGSYTAPTTTL